MSPGQPAASSNTRAGQPGEPAGTDSYQDRNDRPPRRLGPAAARHHLGHRRGQVVIPDMPPRHPARHRERGHVPLQERLLRLAGIHPVDALARVRQPVREQVAAATAARPARPSRPRSRPRPPRPAPCACGTNPARPSAPSRSSASISARRRATYLATYEYDTCASCSSRQPLARPAGRYAAACAARPGPPAASRRSPRHRLPHRRGPLRHLPRSGGTGDAIACRTVRRCTSYFRASARTGIRCRCQSKRIAANSSTLRSIPPHLTSRNTPTQPRSAQPPQMSRNTPGVSPTTPARWGQIRREQPPPRYSRWGRFKGEQWGHFRVLQPPALDTGGHDDLTGDESPPDGDHSQDRGDTEMRATTTKTIRAHSTTETPARSAPTTAPWTVTRVIETKMPPSRSRQPPQDQMMPCLPKLPTGGPHLLPSRPQPIPANESPGWKPTTPSSAGPSPTCKHAWNGWNTAPKNRPPR